MRFSRKLAQSLDRFVEFVRAAAQRVYRLGDALEGRLQLLGRDAAGHGLAVVGTPRRGRAAQQRCDRFVECCFHHDVRIRG